MILQVQRFIYGVLAITLNKQILLVDEEQLTSLIIDGARLFLEVRLRE